MTYATDKPKLINLLHSFKESHCLDARDKIFGLRGLGANGDHLKVDYGKLVTFIFLQALSINEPTIKRLTPSVLPLPPGHLQNALELCC